MKTYDLVKGILEKSPESRNNDKICIWKALNKLGLMNYGGSLSYESFNKAPAFESITRARRKIQELNPDLCPTRIKVVNLRQQKEKTKGTFIFNEETGNYTRL